MKAFLIIITTTFLFLLLQLLGYVPPALASCSNGTCQVLSSCSVDSDCGVGLYCGKCSTAFLGSRCSRQTITDQFSIVNNSLPFNKYAFLTTHNSYAIDGEPSHTGSKRLTFTNQEDTISEQLKNGVRAFMLDTYDFEGDVWLCHSFAGKCYNFTAFEPALDTLKEIEAFMASNPNEIITLILEDYVQAPNGLTKVFNASGLSKYWFPVSKMPKNGSDWPLVSDMVAKNERLLVFTSVASKEKTEGIAYEWNYIVENQYGDGGMVPGNCTNRAESSPLSDMTKSLVLVNYFRSEPSLDNSCVDNSNVLINMTITCFSSAGNRWANFLAVDFYKRSLGLGAFQAVDKLNGKLLCGCDDVRSCPSKFTNGTCPRIVITEELGNAPAPESSSSVVSANGSLSQVLVLLTVYLCFSLIL